MTRLQISAPGIRTGTDETPRRNAARPLARSIRALRRCASFLALAAFALAAQAQPTSGEAVTMPEVELLDGRSLAAEWSTGRIVLVMFWATWCPFCRADLPDMQALHESHGSRGFEILAVSLDRDEADVREFWQKRGYTFHVAMRSPGLRTGFGPISGTPTYFLIDRKGVLRFSHVGGLPEGRLAALIEGLL